MDAVIAERGRGSIRRWGGLALLGLVALLATAGGTAAQGAGGDPELPDLIVNLDLSSKFAKVSAGDTIEMKSWTRNKKGTQEVGPSTTEFYLSADTALDAGDVLIGSQAIPKLKAHATDAMRRTPLTLPLGIAGPYYVIAVADGPHAYPELDETNNVTVSPSILVGPDLSVSDLAVPAQASAGATIAVADVTLNRGAGEAPPSTTGYHLSRNAVRDTGDVLLGGRAIDVLPRDASSDGGTTVLIPGTTRPGCYFVIAVADDGQVATETDETNNDSPAAPIRIHSDLGVTPACSDRDLNGDGTADIVWRNAAGPVRVWLMDGATIAGDHSPGSPSPDWAVQGLGDLNGDGAADIVWRHDSGSVHIWFMNGGTISGTANPGSVGPDWTIQAVGDIDGDGRADILWQQDTGLVHIWFMTGGTISGTASPGSVGPDWTIQTVGDIDGDGRGDILWRHDSGLVHIWFMDGDSIGGTASPGSVGPDWTIQAVGDVNGDGMADIVWRHDSGSVHIWFMDGGTISGTANPGSVSADWTIQSVGDMNGDGRGDILWRHDSGLVHIWFMDGGSIGSTANVPGLAPDWTIQ